MSASLTDTSLSATASAPVVGSTYERCIKSETLQVATKIAAVVGSILMLSGLILFFVAAIANAPITFLAVLLGVGVFLTISSLVVMLITDKESKSALGGLSGRNVTTVQSPPVSYNQQLHNRANQAIIDDHRRRRDHRTGRAMDAAIARGNNREAGLLCCFNCVDQITD